MPPYIEKKGKSLQEIWDIQDSNDFVYELHEYIFDKKWNKKKKLSKPEHVFYMLDSMLSWIEMEGFADLFYQQYSLNDCYLVEEGLKELGANELASLFSEAKNIYIRHQTDIDQIQYEELEPFSLSENEGKRFDQIGEEIYSDKSELFDLAPRLRSYAIKHKNLFA